MPPKIDVFTNMRRSSHHQLRKKHNDMYESGKDAKDKETFGLDEISLRAEMSVSAPSCKIKFKMVRFEIDFINFRNDFINFKNDFMNQIM